jgi:hypothetical protein
VRAITSPNPSAGVETAPIAVIPAMDRSAIALPKAGPDGVSTVSMVEKAAEGSHGIHPETDAHLTDPAMPVNTHQFFAIYYIMTGLHGIHVVIGIGVIGWLLVGALRGRFSSNYYTPVDLVGLYWHVVDLVWIFLFPLFYLIH